MDELKFNFGNSVQVCAHGTFLAKSNSETGCPECRKLEEGVIPRATVRGTGVIYEYPDAKPQK